MSGRTLLLDNNELLPASKVRRVKITSTVNALQLEVDRENDERQASHDESTTAWCLLSVGFYGVDDASIREVLSTTVTRLHGRCRRVERPVPATAVIRKSHLTGRHQ